MKQNLFERTLQGGDRRSIGAANRVARLVLRSPDRLPDLIQCLWSDDAKVRMRAADASEKVSARQPELMQRFKRELLGLSQETSQQELRWHLALMIPRLELIKREADLARTILQCYLQDKSSIVKTCAIQGLAELAAKDPSRIAETVELLDGFCRTGTSAMKARSRKLLNKLHRQGLH